MATALEDAFNGKPVEPVEEPAEEIKAEEPVEEPEEPKGEEKPESEEPEKVEEPEAEPPAAKVTKEVPLPALLDERDKRKAAEARAKDLEKRLEEKKESPNFWDDPEKAVADVRESLEAEFDKKLTEKMFRFSIKTASHRHNDYQEAFDAFKQAAEDNPALANMAADSDDPGDEIYRIGKNFLQLEQSGGDIEAMREKIRAEERDKILAELKAKEDKLSSVPQAITDTQSAAAPRDKVEGGATPLGNILPKT